MNKKLCVNCKYYESITKVDEFGQDTYHMCYRPELADVVTGKATSCAVNRQNNYFCGLDGKYYFKKETEDAF